MGLKTKVIASLGASMHGATRVEYNIFDIILDLREGGFADFDLVAGRYVIDAKSIMGIYSLDLTKPIELQAHTDDAEDLFKAIDKYIVKYSPKAIVSIIRPTLLSVIMFPLTLLLLGPIGTWVGKALADFCVAITSLGAPSMASCKVRYMFVVPSSATTAICWQRRC